MKTGMGGALVALLLTGCETPNPALREHPETPASRTYGVTCGTNTIGGNCRAGTGNNSRQARNVVAFSRVSSAVCGQLRLVQGPTAVGVSTAENLQELIETTVRNDELVIRIRPGACIQPTQDVVIDVATPRLTDLRLTGGIAATFGGGWTGVGALAIGSTGSSRIRPEQPWAARRLTLTATGGLVFEGFPISADDVTVNLTGGGTVQTTARTTLAVTIIGGGTVSYKGRPTVTKSILGGGQVIDAN